MMKNTSSTCDWQNKKRIVKEAYKHNKSNLYKHKANFTWKGIKKEKYKVSGKDWANIIRQTLIGKHGETTKIHVRYFEIAPGGYSSYEIHRHEHVVIGVRGKGVCIIDKRKYKIDFLDTLYIEPNAPHQLRNPYDEPFGFLCIVNAKRDRPKILEV
ncbi:MAG: cupin domain-containing protein [Nitrospirae bacterium]|jgi:quercetin dioxygenase-like cupin family protein|nr:cupin domain-containing protein [Nitrospirota bacterium]